MATRRQRFNDLSVNSQRMVTSAGDWLRTAELVANNSGGGTAATIAYSGDTPSNYTPDSADIEGHLSGIDTALGAVTTEFSGALLRVGGGVHMDFTATRDVVEWETEFVDEGGWADLATDDEIITVPSGVTMVDVEVNMFYLDFASDEPAEYYTYLVYDDGTPVDVAKQWDYFPDPTINSVNSAPARAKMTLRNYPVSEGDTFSVEFNTNSATHNRLVYVSTVETYFCIRKLG